MRKHDPRPRRTPETAARPRPRREYSNPRPFHRPISRRLHTPSRSLWLKPWRTDRVVCLTENRWDDRNWWCSTWIPLRIASRTIWDCCPTDTYNSIRRRRRIFRSVRFESDSQRRPNSFVICTCVSCYTHQLTLMNIDKHTHTHKTLTGTYRFDTIRFASMQWEDVGLSSSYPVAPATRKLRSVFLPRHRTSSGMAEIRSKPHHDPKMRWNCLVSDPSVNLVRVSSLVSECVDEYRVRSSMYVVFRCWRERERDTSLNLTTTRTWNTGTRRTILSWSDWWCGLDKLSGWVGSIHVSSRVIVSSKLKNSAMSNLCENTSGRDRVQQSSLDHSFYDESERSGSFRT